MGIAIEKRCDFGALSSCGRALVRCLLKTMSITPIPHIRKESIPPEHATEREMQLVFLQLKRPPYS